MEVLKRGAGGGRRTDGPFVWEINKYSIESKRKGIPFVQ